MLQRTRPPHARSQVGHASRRVRMRARAARQKCGVQAGKARAAPCGRGARCAAMLRAGALFDLSASVFSAGGTSEEGAGPRANISRRQPKQTAR